MAADDKTGERRLLWRGVATFVAISFALLPFARWWCALIAGATAAYNYWMLTVEIDDERVSRSAVVWTGVVRALIVFSVCLLAVCAERMMR